MTVAQFPIERPSNGATHVFLPVPDMATRQRRVMKLVQDVIDDGEKHWEEPSRRARLELDLAVYGHQHLVTTGKIVEAFFNLVGEWDFRDDLISGLKQPSDVNENWGDDQYPEAHKEMNLRTRMQLAYVLFGNERLHGMLPVKLPKEDEH